MGRSSGQRFLVTGASGQVGGELLHTLAPFGQVIAPLRADMDLANPDSVRAFVRDAKPDWIVSAGAYTAVDKAESEPELAYAINRDAVAAMGVEAKALGASVLHFSTDYVFNGEGTVPWVEDDPTGPLGVYGASKLAGEQALLESGAAAIVFRTSWVYGATGKNFLRTILKLARERTELRIVDDQHGAPTWSRSLAQMAAHVIARSGQKREAAAPFRGIYHVAGGGETTWAGFAREAIAMLQDLEPETSLAKVTGIPSSEYPTAATRPGNSRLNCGKITQAFGWKPVDWRESLKLVIAEVQLPTPTD
ncbi:dTDP-4-dehydrorhamnose reductase [Granulicella aggregans]|uniref:dTDP-4-dehydrorhamnose reductase n=1 Tax=Granulicella aggregans TaxID=474949 RepID=UPI0021DF942E|nr:dTDP-4-dehydrorhamnose reductase [Granulicella aggregans]